MPEMDGYETTRRIRQREGARGHAPVPIVALTANAQEGDRASCLAAGMDDYMTKPLDLDDLARMLRRWTAVLAPSALARIREVQTPGDPDLLTEMIGAFLADAPGHLGRMTDALARGDTVGLANAAHALKGGAAYLGADELQQLCLELETRGRSGMTDGGGALIVSLRAVFDRTRVALIAELARARSDTPPAAA